MKAANRLEWPRGRRLPIVGRLPIVNGVGTTSGIAILGLALACSRSSTEDAAPTGEVGSAVAAGSALTAPSPPVASAAASSAPTPSPIQSAAAAPSVPPPANAPSAGGASANAQQSPTVRVTVSVYPRVAATVTMGKKRLGTTAKGPLVLERGRDSGPLDLVIRAPGYLPLHTRAYTFEDNTIEVRLTRVDKKDTVYGYRQPLPPEDGTGGTGGTGGPGGAPPTTGAGATVDAPATPGRPSTSVAPSSGGRSGVASPN